jgi:hypothetical protein
MVVTEVTETVVERPSDWRAAAWLFECLAKVRGLSQRTDGLPVGDLAGKSIAELLRIINGGDRDDREASHLSDADREVFRLLDYELP